MSLFERYFPVHYDARGAAISLTPDPALGKYTVGSHRPMYIHLDEEEPEDEDDDNLDKALEDSIDAVSKKIGPATGRTDVGHVRTDPDYFGRPRSLAEKQIHTTTARKNSIAPFKHPKFNGPPIGTGGSNQIYTTSPGRKTGTQFGTSRAPLPRHDEDDDSLMFGEEPYDKMYRSFAKHQKNIKKLDNLIDIVDNQEKHSYLSYEEDKYIKNPKRRIKNDN